MKNTINYLRYKFPLLTLCVMTGVAAYAQDNSSSITTTNASTSVTSGIPANWYMNPWVWLGGVILILTLFSVFRSRGKSKREVTRTVTTTTEINSD